MICFELHFLNSIFSPAVEVAGRFENLGELPGKEDTWCFCSRLKNGGTGHLTSTMRDVPAIIGEVVVSPAKVWQRGTSIPERLCCGPVGMNLRASSVRVTSQCA